MPRRPIARSSPAPTNDRPRERLDSLGPAALSDAELLALLLRTGGHRLDALAVAQERYDRLTQTYDNVDRLDWEDLGGAIDGIAAVAGDVEEAFGSMGEVADEAVFRAGEAAEKSRSSGLGIGLDWALIEATTVEVVGG